MDARGRFPGWGVCLTIIVLLTGCQTQPTRASASAPSLVLRNNTYSLLYQLLSEQKDVSKLRFIKVEQVDIKNLTKKIAAASKAGAEELEEFSHRDSSIDLKAVALPTGEVKTRDAIAKTKEKELLTRKGKEFDLTLLLTQTEALSYGWHLAKVAAQYDTDPARVRALHDLAGEMEALYNETFDLVRSLPPR
jgi:hypothetical protein